MKNQVGKQLECSETEYSQAYLQLSLTSNNKCKCGSLELSCCSQLSASSSGIYFSLSLSRAACWKTGGSQAKFTLHTYSVDFLSSCDSRPNETHTAVI